MVNIIVSLFKSSQTLPCLVITDTHIHRCWYTVSTVSKSGCWKSVNCYSPCDRRSADSLRFVCDPQEEDNVSVRNQSANRVLTPTRSPSPSPPTSCFKCDNQQHSLPVHINNTEHDNSSSNHRWIIITDLHSLPLDGSETTTCHGRHRNKGRRINRRTMSEPRADCQGSTDSRYSACCSEWHKYKSDAGKTTNEWSKTQHLQSSADYFLDSLTHWSLHDKWDSQWCSALTVSLKLRDD